METVELKELVAACVRKERKAQHMFFKAYYGKMLSVCLRYIKDRDSAQEVVQDGFIKVFDKLEFFDLVTEDTSVTNFFFLHNIKHVAQISRFVRT